MPLLVQVAASVLFTGVILAALIGAWLLIDAARDAVDRWRERRRARLEAELDRTQSELRAVIFELADRIAVERAEGRAAEVELVRRHYLATGHVLP